MKRRQLLKFAAAAGGISIAGVPLTALAAASPSGVINIALQPEPPGILTAIVQNGPALLVGGNISESLLRYNDKLEPEPSLATSWTVSPDGLVYTFNLKPNVKWHDGKPFSADDVVFSVDVFLRKTNPRLRQNIETMESVRALDPLKVEFRMKEPFPAFINAFSPNGMPIVAKHVYENSADFLKDPANAAPIGTGPFKFKQWVRGSYIELARFDDYHIPGLPHVESLFFQVIPDAASRAAAFEAGKIDILPGGSVEFFDIGRLAKLPGVEVTKKGWELFSPMSWIEVNNRTAPLNDRNFRNAISLAVDRELMRKVAWYGYADIPNGPFNSHLKDYATDLPKLKKDVAKAKALVAASSYKGETLRLLPLPYGETWQRLAEMTRVNLAAVGIKTELVPTDVAGWNSRLNNWDFDLSFNYLYQQGDPAIGVSRNYVSSAIAKGSPFNNTEGYVNPKVDALFAAAQKEIDPVKRKALYVQVQHTLVEDMPVVWLHELNFPTVYHGKVKNPINSAVGLNDSLGHASVS